MYLIDSKTHWKQPSCGSSVFGDFFWLFAHLRYNILKPELKYLGYRGTLRKNDIKILYYQRD